MNPPEDTPPRRARFQFGLGTMMAWILWLGLCIAAAVATEGIPREIFVVAVIYSAMALALTIHHAVDESKRRTDES
ncbi:MAG: hypothetical protein L6R28_00920 [Planctomycetes bacterium]|nr:hypothetical protein [Planctomycetota bacterium]